MASRVLESVGVFSASSYVGSMISSSHVFSIETGVLCTALWIAGRHVSDILGTLYRDSGKTMDQLRAIFPFTPESGLEFMWKSRFEALSNREDYAQFAEIANRELDGGQEKEEAYRVAYQECTRTPSSSLNSAKNRIRSGIVVDATKYASLMMLSGYQFSFGTACLSSVAATVILSGASGTVSRLGMKALGQFFVSWSYASTLGSVVLLGAMLMTKSASRMIMIVDSKMVRKMQDKIDHLIHISILHDSIEEAEKARESREKID